MLFRIIFSNGERVAACPKFYLLLINCKNPFSPNQWDANLPEFQKILKRHIRPSLTCSQNDFQFSYREADGVRYLYVLNYNIDRTREGEFSVPGSVKVTDMSLVSPQVLSVTERNGYTCFRTKLAPAELALFKIETVK